LLLDSVGGPNAPFFRHFPTQITLRHAISGIGPPIGMDIAFTFPEEIKVVTALPKEIVVNKTYSSRCQVLGLILGVAAVISFLAATAWAAQPTGKKSSQDDAANKAIRRDNPVNRGAGNSSGAGRNIQSGNSSAAFKHIESNSVTKKSPSSQGIKLVDSKPVASGLQNAAGSLRLADIDKDKKGKGNKDSGGGPPPVTRGNPPEIQKKTDSGGNKSGTKRTDLLPRDKKPSFEGVKKNTNLLPPSGNKSSIDDVRKRFDKNTGSATPNRQLSPDAFKRLQGQKNFQKNVFQERLKAGDYQRLTAGDAAKKLKLADQYRLYQKGDVARQLALQKHGMHPALYHGVVSPAYNKHCMKYNYWGPAFFAGACMYPYWSPWVDWSWHHHCHWGWDPRPIWCRPVYYEPCPTWVYWQTPMWNPLPEVSCGTWVDLKPVEVPAGDADLQLVAVRFVDPGHPEEKLGPRYRVWFRNNGSEPVAQPFSVMLFAGNNERLAEGMAQAGVRVTSVEPAAIQSVDVRLPVEVLALGRDAKGNPTPFSVLQVLVDANQEITETTRDNNGTRLAPADVLPIDPATFELKPKSARPGEEILLAGEGFGPQPGRVLVQVGDQELDGEILGWYDLGVQWTLPKLAVNAPVDADVVVIRGDGAAANPVKIKIRP
jgi:hypothetical protein